MCIIYPQFTVSNFYEFLSEELYLKIRPYYIKKERIECYICKIGSNTFIKLLKIDLLFSLEIFRVAIPAAQELFNGKCGCNLYVYTLPLFKD